MTAFLHRSLSPTVVAACFSLWSATEAIAQKPAWIIGNHVVDFRQAYTGVINDYPLPQPTDVAAPLRYNGQVASKSQYVQLDDRGEILFFLIDGAIYDRKGYLIADNDPTGIPDPDNCSECVPTGSSEVAVIQVPGDCSKFYIFTTHHVTSITAPWTLYVSVLDLAAQNPYFNGDAGKKGVLMDETMLDNAGIDLISTYYPIGGDRQVLWVLNDPNYPIDYLPEHTYSGCNGALHMEAVDGIDTEEKFFLVTTGAHIARWRVLDTGLEYLGSDATTCSLGGVPDNSECQRSAKGDLEVWRSGDDLKVAQTAYDYNPITQTFYYRIVHHAYTWSGTDLILTASGETVVLNSTALPLNGNGDLITQPGMGGLEFSPNGEWLYFTLSHPGPLGQQFGFVVMSNYSVGFYPLDFYDFVDTEIELNASNVTGSAIYLCGYNPLTQTHRFGRWTYPDNGYAPPPTYWQDDVYELPGITNLDAQLPGDEVYHLEMNQTANDQSDQRLASGGCCEAVFTMTSEADYTAPTGSQTWTAASNPFGNSEIVRFAGELVIPDGSTVTIEDMTFEFGPEAVVIVEPGGYLFSDGSTFTSACNSRWKGVEVRGNSSLGQTPYSNQGRFRTLNAVVENAEEGAVAATIDGNGNYVATGYRGVIQSANTQWHNNVVDVKIPWTGLFNSMNRFQTCDFVVDADWPSGPDPYAHALLSDCGKVLFQNCKFRNTNVTFTGADRGFGVLSSGRAAPRILGNNDPAVSYFEGLWCGASIGRHFYYWLHNMNVRNCTYGLVDLGPNLGEVTGNVFDVPEWTAGPSPIGVLLYQTKNYVVEDNTFQSTAPNSNAGVAFWGPMESTNRIYNNVFKKLSLGSFVIGDHQDEQTIELLGLEILCNDFGGLNAGNNVDYGVGPQCAIASEQGDAFDVLNLAGNRFFNDPDCIADHDMAYDDPAGSFNYNRHDEVPCADCDVICDDVPYINEVVPFPGDPFDKPVSCANPFAPDGGIIIGHETDARKLAKAQFESALALYNSELDCGSHAELLAALEQDEPWLASHTLRDMLISCHPLRNAVLQAVIDRGQPMDPWHITQVFLQNVPLDKKLEKELSNSGLLNNYQLALIEQAQAGGINSYKRLLEREIHQRAMEHYMAYTNCARYWAADTLDPGAEDSLRLVLEDGISTGDRMALLLYHLHSGNWTELQAMLQESWFLDEKHADLRDYVGAMRNVYGNVGQLSATELQDFEALANAGNAGAGLCWSVLLQRDHWRYLPELPILSGWKRYDEVTPVGVVLESLALLQVQPSPATDVINVTYDTRSAPDALMIHGPMGNVVYRAGLSGANGLVELDVRNWGSGVYLARTELEGIPLAEVKFTVLGDSR